MNRIVACLALCHMFAGPQTEVRQQAKNLAEEEIRRFQGSWSLKSCHWVGREADNTDFPNRKICFRQEGFTCTWGDKVISKGKLVINPSVTPKAIDLYVLKNGKIKATPSEKGIYRIQADTLTTCFAVIRNDPRPTEFPSKSNFKLRIMVWVRDKPGREPNKEGGKDHSRCE